MITAMLPIKHLLFLISRLNSPKAERCSLGMRSELKLLQPHLRGDAITEYHMLVPHA